MSVGGPAKRTERRRDSVRYQRSRDGFAAVTSLWDAVRHVWCIGTGRWADEADHGGRRYGYSFANNAGVVDREVRPSTGLGRVEPKPTTGVCATTVVLVSQCGDGLPLEY